MFPDDDGTQLSEATDSFCYVVRSQATDSMETTPKLYNHD